MLVSLVFNDDKMSCFMRITYAINILYIITIQWKFSNNLHKKACNSITILLSHITLLYYF